MADTIGNTELKQFSYRLCLGVKDTTVYFFDKLVKKAKYNKSTNSENNNDNQDSSDSVDAVQPLEFTKELYDEALALPEAKSVQLEYSNDATLYQYGKFKGGKTYKNFTGEIDQKSASSAYGWIQLVNFTDEYFIFTSAGSVYIIACKDFSPEPVVLDFMPLYEKLKMWDDSTTEKYKDPVVYSVTDKQLNKDTGKYRIYNFVNESSKINEENEKEIDKSKPAEIKNGSFYYHVPGQISNSNIEVNKDNKSKISAYNDIQAMIYDMPNNDPTYGNSISQLLCYQQPESISYNAEASYEAVNTRGTQQPFQLYSNANAISLSFVLKWHNDEVKTFSTGVEGPTTSSSTSLSLQTIADIAENFTRPWERGNSISPKLVKVILPGISEIGYMTSAQITYNGDMTGDLTNADTKLDGLNSSWQGAYLRSDGLGDHQYATNYYYTQLEITFTLLIVKDIKLMAETDSKATWSIVADNKDMSYDSDDNSAWERVRKEAEENRKKSSEQKQEATTNDDVKQELWTEVDYLTEEEKSWSSSESDTSSAEGE